MNISELLNQKKCVYSFELFPPKKDSPVGTIYDALGAIADISPDYISVTYGAGGNGGKNTAKLARAVKDAGMEVLPHITCIGSTKEAVMGTLDELENAGASSVMALRGDRVEGVDGGDFEYASELVSFILDNKPGFSVAGACYPEGHVEAKNRYEDIKNLRKKVEAGVSHLNSQLFFDNDDFFEFLELIDLAGISVPVQAGIMPIVKASQINRIVSMTGVKIPSKLSRLLSRYGSDEQALMDAGIAYATEQIADLIAGGARGIHLYMMNNIEVAKRITDNISSMIKRINGQE